MLFSKKLVKKYGNDKIVALSLQPGVIRGTDLIWAYKRSEIIKNKSIKERVYHPIQGGVFSFKQSGKKQEVLQKVLQLQQYLFSIPQDQISNSIFYHKSIVERKT